MGSYTSSPAKTETRVDDSSHKRTFDQMIGVDAVHDVDDAITQTPQRLRLSSTQEYLHQTLFVEGTASDVTIHCRGREWRLHKLYLRQCGRLKELLDTDVNGNEPKDVYLDIEDELVTSRGLDTTFGSLYMLPRPIGLDCALEVLAAASWVDFPLLVDRCQGILVANLRPETVCAFHRASVQYKLDSLEAACLRWLTNNLMIDTTVDLLRSIDCSLMRQIIASPELVVMHVEMDIYLLLRSWLFLQLEPCWDGTTVQLRDESETFFSTYDPLLGPRDFLSTDFGKPYVGPFRALRLPNIISDFTSTRILEMDDVIPKSWLVPVYRRQWLQMLKVEQGYDLGPQRLLRKHPAAFQGSSLRCGTVLQGHDACNWRWTGHNFGHDVIMNFDKQVLSIQRNVHSQEVIGSVSLQSRRSLLFQATVFSLDDHGHVTQEKRTSIIHASLGLDEDVVVMKVDKDVEFPIYVSFSFLLTTPSRTLPTKTPS